MSNIAALLIDFLVAVLLVLTIVYCMMLNRRLKLLKADEQSLRGTISELVTATEIAERAIGGLKATVQECDLGLGERLRKAERVTVELDRALAAAKVALGAETAEANSNAVPDEQAAPAASPAPAAPRQDARAVAAAAEAFAERLRARVRGAAA